MGLSPLRSLQVLEGADQYESLEAWAAAFSAGIAEAMGALECHLFRFEPTGKLRLIPRKGAILDAEAQARLTDALLGCLPPLGPGTLARSGIRAVSMGDLGADPDRVREALAELHGGPADVLWLCGARGVRAAMTMPRWTTLHARCRSVLRNVGRHMGTSVALRSALERQSQVPEHELPTKLRHALAELETRRDAEGGRDDAVPTLTFLDSLSQEGFAVVQSSRSGRRRRLIAVRPKDDAARAMRTLDAGERQVLEGLKRGLSLKEIAFELEIAEATVSGRIARIRAKIGIDPRSEVVRIAEAHARLA